MYEKSNILNREWGCVFRVILHPTIVVATYIIKSRINSSEKQSVKSQIRTKRKQFQPQFEKMASSEK